MGKFSHTIEIAAPMNRVAAFFVPQRMVYWYGAEIETSLTLLDGSADFAVGQKVRVEARVARRVVTFTAVVTEYAPGRVLEWRFVDSYGVRGLQRWEIAAAGEGARVAMRDEYELPGRLGRILDWFVTRRAVAWRGRRDLERLKRLAERR